MSGTNWADVYEKLNGHPPSHVSVAGGPFVVIDEIADFTEEDFDKVLASFPDHGRSNPIADLRTHLQREYPENFATEPTP